jgi:tRNA pseudouridine38-40 synthase
MRWLVQFGYDGAAFGGWARQPGLRTVEGEIRRGLVGFGVVPDADVLGMEAASRTDRGVSARANALALHTTLPGATLLRTLNGIDPDLFFTAAVPIADDFRVRHAVHRTYRYFEANPIQEPTRRDEAAALFSGVVDVRSFGRSVAAVTPAWRSVDFVRVLPAAGGSVVEVRAPVFVWGMVRKIVAALREVDAERLSTARLRSALEGRARLTLPLAEPEPLVLWNVEYPFPWTVFWRGPNRPQSVAVVRRRGNLWTRTRVLEAMLDAMAPSNPPG